METDRLTGKLDFKASHQEGLGSFSVLCSCWHADYDSRLPTAHGALNQQKTGLRKTLVYILHTEHSCTHS